MTRSKKECTQKLALNLFGSNMLHVCGKLAQPISHMIMAIAVYWYTYRHFAVKVMKAIMIV